MGGVDLVGVPVQHLDLSAQDAQDLEADRHIADVRQVLDDTDVRCQNGSRQDAHSRIFGARNGDFAVQGLTARNNKFFQFYDLLVMGLRLRRPKRSFNVVIPSSLYKCCTTIGHNYSYLIIHNFQQKAKPQLHARRLFSVLPSLLL